MKDEIINKVANSVLEVFDLEDYFPDEHVVELDLSQWLFEGFLLKEKDFREQLKNFDWSIYKDKYVGITCSTDAVLPAWTFALVAVYLKPFALTIIQGNKEAITISWYEAILSKIDYSPFQDRPIILKGCSKKEVPQEVYTLAIQKLIPFAKSIMFGEACSAVPLYKRK
jgi:hypothetical protein